MRQTKTFPLLRASQINSLHPTEIQLPGLVSAKNVYISPSDNAITLRHDFYTFREDIPTVVDHWTGSTSADKSDFLNILLTGPASTDQQFITRLAPTGLGGTVLSSTYIDGTITTTGSSSVVTGSSTTWVKNIWPGSFIQFAGSNNIYLILRVESDTSLTVDGTPPALSGVTYKVYRTHDYERGLYPGHFDQLANNYVYNMATPFDNDADSINSICGPFTMVKPIARVPEIQELLNDKTPALQTVEEADVYAGSVSSLSKVVHDGTRYCVCGLVHRPVTDSNKYQAVIVFLVSTDGSTWTTSAEYVPDNVPVGFNSASSNCDNSINGLPNLRYIASDGFYATYSQAFMKPDSYIQRNISVILKSTDGTNWLRFADRVVEMDRRYYNEMYDVNAVPDICKDASNYYATIAGRIIKIASDGTQTQVFPPSNSEGNFFQFIVWNGTNLVAISKYLIATSPDGSTWTRVGTNASGAVPAEICGAFVGASNHIWYLRYSALGSGQAVTAYLSSDNGATWTSKISFNTWLQQCGGAYDATDGLTIFTGTAYYYYSTTNQWTMAGQIYTTPDESAFTSRTVPTGTKSLCGVCPVLGATTGWVAIGGNGVIINSTNGTSWAAVYEQDKTPDLYSIATYNGGLTVAGENGSIALSPIDGQWSFQTTLTTKDLYDALQTDAGLIVCGETGTIKTSSGGTSWTSRTSGVTVTLRGIAWDNIRTDSRVVVVVGDATGGAGVVLTSSDFITWTGRTSNTTKSLNDVCHNGSNLFVAVGEDGAIIASADGTTWAAKTSGTSEDLNGVCYSKPLLKFCAVGDAGTILTSTDGTTWAAATSGISTDLYAVTWTGSTLVAVGASGVMVESQDGSTWTSLDTDTTAALYDVIGVGDYRLAVGANAVAVKVYNTTLSSQWVPVSDTYRSAGFSVAAGFLVLVGTSEYENGRWVYHPRRVRWAVPGTVDTWEGEGAGGTDLQGTGAILDCRTLGYNIILFESSQISALNSTDDIYSPFSYQVIHSNMRAISNPLVIDQLCYFITPDGKLYRTNGFNVQEVCQPFDLTKYKDFDDAGPIWLTYDREIRRILCYRPRVTDTVHECFVVDPDNATVTVQELPSVTVAGGGYYKGSSGINFARSIPSIPTDYKFISTLEVTDTDGDGDYDFPSKTPIQVRWIVSDEDDGEIFRGMTYNSTATLFVICGFGGKIYTITSANVSATTVNDDHDCTAQVSGTTEDLWGVAYDGTKYVAVGTNGTVIYSSNATSWSAGTAAVVNATDTIVGICDSTTAPRIVAWVDDGSSMYILYSEDNGATFSLGQTGFGTIYSIEYVNSKFVMVGDLDSDWYSSDGITWTQILDTDLTLTSAQNTFYLSSQYHVCGSDGNWVHSTNLTDWVNTTIDTEIDSTCGELANSAWMFTGTYQDPADYIMFTDNGERFFYVRKPTPPTHNEIECWTMVWTGTYLCVLGTDRA